MVVVPAPVLVVEDDPTIRDTIFLVLHEEGYPVQTVEHGAAALRRIRAQTFGLILLDMQMPVMDGRTFAAAYRSLFTFHAPLVVMSAAMGGSAWADEVHADAYIGKPFDVDILVDTVNRLALPACGIPRRSNPTVPRRSDTPPSRTITAGRSRPLERHRFLHRPCFGGLELLISPGDIARGHRRSLEIHLRAPSP